jgi:AcrR family transcriptional regulator
LLYRRWANKHELVLAAIAHYGQVFFNLLADSGLTPAQAREKLLDDDRLRGDQIIYQRAHDRGEINLDHVPPAVLALPFDLVRHDLFMNLEPLKRARIESIVDQLFLPLVQVTLPT